LGRELPKRQRACRMVALTRDLHVFASRVTTQLSAVFFSVRYITQARYVRTLCGFLIRIPTFLSDHFSDLYSNMFFNGNYAVLTVEVVELIRYRPPLGAASFSTDCIPISKPTSPLAPALPRFWV
jgi:hypothetical protein